MPPADRDHVQLRATPGVLTLAGPSPSERGPCVTVTGRIIKDTIRSSWGR